MSICDSGYCCTKIDNLGVVKGSDIILENVSFHIHCGQLTTIIGRNGAGKTTLIKALLGDIKHTGNIRFQNHHGREKKLRIGYVPQKLSLDENSPTSVYDLCASFLSSLPVFAVKSKRLYKTVEKKLSDFGAEKLIDKRMCDLSGGETQRVLLSLAMTPVPDILLLDEPVSGMDQEGLDTFYKKLTELKNSNDIAVVMISHDFQYVSKYSDRVILLDKTVLCNGTPEEVLSSEAFKKAFKIDLRGYK